MWTGTEGVCGRGAGDGPTVLPGVCEGGGAAVAEQSGSSGGEVNADPLMGEGSERMYRGDKLVGQPGRDPIVRFAVRLNDTL